MQMMHLSLLWQVSVGTANFNDPLTTIKVVDGIRDYCAKNGVADINELIGCVK